MAHDVFISYAVEDRAVADTVCQALEGQGIKCWIAPRDIPLGAEYEEAIVDAIGASPLLVLILSANSNQSPYVRREIQNACAEGSPTQVIPFRIADIPYSKTLRFYLGSTQWLDASTPPLESHLQRLVEQVRTRLRGLGAGVGTPEARAGAQTPTGTTTGTGDVPPVIRGTGDGVSVRGTGDGRTFQGTGDGRKPRTFAWLAVAGGAALAIVVIALLAYRSSDGGNSQQTGNIAQGGSINSGSATPAASPGAPTQTPTAASPTPQRTPAPTPTPAASPAPAASPRPPRNINLRLPVNLGSVANLARPAPPDWDIKAQIQKRLASHDQLSNVQVEVSDGVVTLTGSAPTEDWRKTAQMISGLEGVRRVINKIEVR